MEERLDRYDDFPTQNLEKPKIPKVINYCWFGGKPMPQLCLECMESWNKHLPDYEIVRWDESNSPLDAAPFVIDAYKEEMWAFVSDYVRVNVLLKTGGIYLDTDMMVFKSLDPFLCYSAFAGFENQDNVNLGIFEAEPNHPFLQACLDWYNSHKFNLYHPPIITKKVVNKILKENGLENYGRQQIFNIELFPTEYFYPWSWRHRIEQPDYRKFIKPETYAVHLWNHGWQRKKSIIQKVFCNIKSFVKSKFRKKPYKFSSNISSIP
jgi:mannosyltransferase OCH1-like enzyme